MPLDSLLSLVEKLRRRIDTHGSKLHRNEALTRYALIDPLLRELGWDTEDPTLVIPEYKEAGGSADYALFSGNKPLMIVEAKKLDTSLRDEKVLIQGLAYCQKQGTRYLSVTDGRRWEIYEPHRGGAVPIDKKRIVEFDLKNGSAAEVCSKALVLRRSNVERLSDAVYLLKGEDVADETVLRRPNIERLPDSPSPPEGPTPKHQPPSPGLDEHEWQPISEPSLEKSSRPPLEIQFPDDSSVSLAESWKSLLVEVTRWLVNANHLEITHCPIPSRPGGRKYYAVSTESTHPNGSQFTSLAQVGPFCVHAPNDRAWSVPAARTIIKHVGQDPTQFKVRFSSPRTQAALS